MLDMENVNGGYGQARVLFDVNLHVAKGEAVGLIGRNGSGKSSTFRSIMGLLPSYSGSVRLDGEEIGNEPTYRIARRGVGLVPEDRRMLANMSVDENLRLGREGLRHDRSPVTPEEMYELFPLLRPLRRQNAGLLSGGEQQMLAIARALMSGPRVLMLDEPAEGLAPIIVEGLQEQLIALNQAGTTLLLAEQNYRFLAAIVSRVYVLDRGVVRFEGSVKELQDNPDVLTRYLAV